MKILVLNCGSSSIKYALYNMDDKSVMTSGGAERVGLDGAFVKVKLANGEKKQIMHDIPEHTEGVKFIFSLLTDPEIGVIKSLDEIDAVGHRMVHGGEKFNKSVVLTDEVLKVFEECSDLAPLHNPANLKGVNAVKELMPGLPQVGVFDTAFHQTMPDYAYMYAIPYELYKQYGVRRYGFHGTSHRYVSARALEFLGMKPEVDPIVVPDPEPEDGSGDANGDSRVDIDDLTLVIAYVLGDSSLETKMKTVYVNACDVDMNGSVDVDDVTELIQMLLNSHHDDSDDSPVVE